ncbi:glycosyltransferase family 2 protein [Chloroflexota bacterium]
MNNNDQSASLVFSVAFPTYNRADLLSDILDDLSKQTFPTENYEVLIIDNNSSDNTAEITQKYCAEHANFHYIFEEKQGIGYGRSRAYQEAQGKYLAYTDDDCRIPADWLATAQSIIEQYNPVIFGGPYQAYYIDRPKWAKDDYWSSLDAIGHRACWLPDRQYLSAGNMFVKKSILVELQGFNPAFGSHGKKKYYGEETEFQIRVCQTYPDLKFYYDPALCVSHLVNPQKLNFRTTLHYVFRLGRAGTHINKVSGDRENLTTLRKFKRFLRISSYATYIIIIPWMMSFGTLLRNRSRFPYWQNYWYEAIKPKVQALGGLYERLSVFLRFTG